MLETSQNSISLSERVPLEYSGTRLDSAAAELFPDFSRARLQSWIKQGALLVDGRQVKPNVKVVGGELLVLEATPEPQGEWLPQDVPFEVVYEDEALIIVNKPVGLVVHPAAGNLDGTLLNGLLYRYPQLIQIPRAGIVHRLDKDTSGLMVVAKTLESQVALVAQLQERSVSRVYEAVVHGVPEEDGSIDANIGRHPSNRLKMAVVPGGKSAVTHYQVLQFNEHFSHVRLKLETGRTHQIRVHMAHIGHPLVGDPTYGRSVNQRILRQDTRYLKVEKFARQALHAARLGLDHPSGNQTHMWRAALPEDMEMLIDELFS